MIARLPVFSTLRADRHEGDGRTASAAAVLIDATIIRGVLLPATMKLLGEWNWYLPRWLNWLPELKHETETGPGPVAIPRSRPLVLQHPLEWTGPPSTRAGPRLGPLARTLAPKGPLAQLVEQGTLIPRSLVRVQHGPPKSPAKRRDLCCLI